MEMEIERSSPLTTIDASSASYSTAAGPSTSGSSDYRYDVFINHRGPDTKKTFATDLYRRLLSHGFRTFLDQQELQEGLNFPSQIADAIRTASVHLAIFSPRYAESPWCLDELLLMRKSGAPIIPVFYKVMPAELRRTQNKSGVFGEALHNLQMKKTKDPQTDMTAPRYDCATIQNWRDALSSVADISGFDLAGAFNGDDSRMLDKIVQRVVNMVPKTQLHVAKFPTGLDGKIKDFERTLLKQHQHSGNVQVIGIVGLGGMGKTTLALELFNRKRSNYNESYFLADVRENARSSSLHSLQSKVMKGLTRGLIQSEFNIDNIYEGIGKLKKHLRSSHVLLILDDIDHEDQLDAFLPVKDVKRSDSLILITSRNRDVLRRSGVEEASIYKLTGLPTKHSRELFCSYAFCQAYPPKGFEDLVNKFLMACQGLPLSLKVLGALVLGKNDNRSFWEDTLSQVHEVPDDIQKRLKISYDALHEKEQQIFLDIACFFIGEKRDITVRIWDEPGWKGSSGFQNLESKCLVEVDSNKYIHMHDHLRDLGREIARDKLPRRVWHPRENIDDLLQQSYVITEVRGIRTFLNTDRDNHGESLSWYQRKSEALFGKWVMRLYNRLNNTRYHSPGIGAMKLQLLQTEGHLLERIVRRVNSPNLIWLSWRDCPYSFLPSWIPAKNLRVLKVQGKVLKTLWQGRSQAPFQLRELEISGNLLKISKSIGQLKHLERICFHNAHFQKLPEEFCNMRLLKVLVLNGCSELKVLPDSFGNLTNLQGMWLTSCHGLERLPESLGNLTNLQFMKLMCRRLERLPESFGNLTNLQLMKLIECQSLVSLPQSLGNLTNLRSIRLCRCPGLKMLPEPLGNLTNLQSMKLIECPRLEMLPESLGNLTNLQSMKLIECRGLERLPESLGNLTNLQLMELIECRRLKRLPESLGNLTNLLSMQFCRCQGLERLPESLGNLTNLQHMKLVDCRRLERLPESLGNLTNLQLMVLSGCGSLESLPESLSNLTNLKRMVLSGCGSLESLPSIKTLVRLKELRTSYCVKLKSIPDLAQLTKLKLLGVDGCLALEELDGVEHCISLLRLTALGCPNLKWGEGVVMKLRQHTLI